jgi:hypothetical protein
MKATDSRQSPLASQVLNLVGVILILSFLAELLVLLIPAQFNNPQWQVDLITQLVDRGVLPLIGFAFIYVGFGLQPATGTAQQGTWRNPRFWAFVVASLLGLLFLLLIPFHINTTGQLSQQAVSNIDQRASQAEIQIQQRQGQIRSLVESGQIDQLIQNNQVPPEQLPLLQRLKQDPKALDQEAEAARNQIRTQQQQAQAQARADALRSRIRVGLRSLLLAIGYITIGWSGLREVR